MLGRLPTCLDATPPRATLARALSASFIAMNPSVRSATPDPEKPVAINRLFSFEVS
jgi:hypothetical protein